MNVNKNKAVSRPRVHPFRWKVFFSAIVAIIAGYIMLATGDITLAPVLLVLGYCVLVPLSFL